MARTRRRIVDGPREASKPRIGAPGHGLPLDASRERSRDRSPDSPLQALRRADHVRDGSEGGRERRDDGPAECEGARLPDHRADADPAGRAGAGLVRFSFLHLYRHPRREEAVRSRRCRPLAERFEAKIDRTPGFGPRGECWRWTGHIGKNGYSSRVSLGRRGEGAARAHRIAFFLDRGRWPAAGLDVCHSCDVRSCVNPAHLFEGTRRENLADMNAKGRRRTRVYHGESHRNAKLSAEQVVAIRARSCTARAAAERFGISISLVHKLRTGIAWKESSGDSLVVCQR